MNEDYAEVRPYSPSGFVVGWEVKRRSDGKILVQKQWPRSLADQACDSINEAFRIGWMGIIKISP